MIARSLLRCSTLFSKKNFLGATPTELRPYATLVQHNRSAAIDQYINEVQQHGNATYANLKNQEGFINSKDKHKSEAVARDLANYCSFNSNILGLSMLSFSMLSAFVAIKFDFEPSKYTTILSAMLCIIPFEDAYNWRKELPKEIKRLRTEDLQTLKYRMRGLCDSQAQAIDKFPDAYDLFFNAKIRILKKSSSQTKISTQEKKYIEDLLTLNLSKENRKEYQKYYVGKINSVPYTNNGSFI